MREFKSAGAFATYLRQIEAALPVAYARSTRAAGDVVGTQE